MEKSLISFLASDAFLSSTVLLVLAVVSLKLFPFDRSAIRNAPGQLRDMLFGNDTMGSKSYRDTAISAFYHYDKLATIDIDQMRKSYARLSRSHKRIGYELGYPDKLDRLAIVTRVNSVVARAIARAVLAGKNDDTIPAFPANNADIGKVREALKHLIRDWSSAGAQERNATFTPILDVLSKIESARRRRLKVLVPGSGLGRLAWEISQLRFEVTAVEISPFMNFAFHFLLSPQATSTPNQHTICPYAHWFSHQRTNDNLFRHVSFPDAVPRLSSSFQHIKEDFFALKSPGRISSEGRPEAPGFDVIITLFFIDTSLNVIATLEKIRELLRVDGMWINLGPLLWMGGSQASMELSLDELLQLANKVGFDVDEKSRKTLDCEYTSDPTAMMQWIYKAEFWTATRRA